MKGLVLALLWVAVLARAIVVFGRRRTVWRVLGITAVLATAAGTSIAVSPGTVDRLLWGGAHLVLGQLCLQVAAITGAIYLHGLARCRALGTRTIAVILGVTSLAHILASATVPPEVLGGGAVVGDPGARFFVLVHHLIMVLAQVVVTVMAFRLARSGRQDPWRSAGMAAIGVGGIIGATGHVLGWVHQSPLVAGTGSPAVSQEAGVLAGGLALIAYAGGLIAILAGPASSRVAGHVRTIWALRALRDALRSNGNSSSSAAPASILDWDYRAERMITEVLDGLAGLPVRPGGPDPVEDIVTALLDGGHDGGRPAIELLPTGPELSSEREALIDLGHRVRRRLG